MSSSYFFTEFETENTPLFAKVNQEKLEILDLFLIASNKSKWIFSTA